MGMAPLRAVAESVNAKLQEHRGEHGIDSDAENSEVEIEGLISELTATSVTVSAGPSASVACSVPAGVSVAGFAVGDEVEIVQGSFELRELESDEHEVEFDPADHDDNRDDDHAQDDEDD